MSDIITIFTDTPLSDWNLSIVAGIVLAAIVAALSYRFAFLDTCGSILAFIMGAVIFGFGGWAYTFPILVFFILSSILSKSGRKRKKRPEISYQKGAVRNAYQVLANGGVPTALVLVAYFSQSEPVFYLYIAAIAAATADTWGTEIGILAKSRPVFITNLKPVPPGTSGAISVLGSFSALSGSFIIVLTGGFFIGFNLYQMIILTLIGFGGSLMDSLLGATIQGQFKCAICKKTTEKKNHCGSETTLQKGIYWFDNDLVNIGAVFYSTLVAFLIFIKEIF